MPTKDVTFNSGDKIPVQQFKLNSMEENPSIVLIAPRRSGKSWIVRAILHHMRDIPCGMIISGSERVTKDPFYSKFFPDSYIFYEYKSEIIERLMKRQQVMMDKLQERISNGKRPIDIRSYIVMDDCLGQKGSWGRDPPILELLFNGRHYQLTYILTMQFPLGITPELRSNFDYIFLLAENKVSNQKRIWDHYAGMFPTFDSFRQVFSNLTKDHGAMVIANKGADKDVSELIYWYKAPDLTSSRMELGGRQFLDYHKKNYNNDWKKNSKGMNFNEYCMDKKRSKGTINIEKQEVDDKGRVINKKK